VCLFSRGFSLFFFFGFGGFFDVGVLLLESVGYCLGGFFFWFFLFGCVCGLVVGFFCVLVFLGFFLFWILWCGGLLWSFFMCVAVFFFFILGGGFGGFFWIFFFWGLVLCGFGGGFGWFCVVFWFFVVFFFVFLWLGGLFCFWLFVFFFLVGGFVFFCGRKYLSA